MVSTFFLVVVSPRNIFLVVIISGDSSLIWMFEKFFFLKHEEGCISLYWEGKRVVYIWHYWTAVYSNHWTHFFNALGYLALVTYSWWWQLHFCCSLKQQGFLGYHYIYGDSSLIRMSRTIFFSNTQESCISLILRRKRGFRNPYITTYTYTLLPTSNHLYMCLGKICC